MVEISIDLETRGTLVSMKRIYDEMRWHFLNS